MCALKKLFDTQITHSKLGPESLACQIYKQTVMQLFECFLLDSSPRKYCDKLDRLQENAIRIIHCCKTFENGKRVYMDLKDLNVVEDDVIVTRSTSKVKFVSDFTSLTCVQNSP